MISIREALHTYAASLNRLWEHDRSKTVGASEIGQCERKVWFSKHDAPRDPEYQDGWGARVRGDIIEAAFWEPAVRSQLPPGVSLLFAGSEQYTFVSGYLSATTDGLMVWNTGACVLDNKSSDPRSMPSAAKPEHAFQIHTQIGVIRECTEHRPDHGVLTYINASFWDDIREFVIPFNPRIYRAAQDRAHKIMTATNALELEPEGKMSGGDECAFCAWASHCRDVTVAGVPERRETLGDMEIHQLKMMRNAERLSAAEADAAAAEHAKDVENIKQFLREVNSRGWKGEDWGVSYSVTAGRTTLDIQAIEAAGIDLTPYYKTGKPSDRLTVR